MIVFQVILVNNKQLLMIGAGFGIHGLSSISGEVIR